MQLKSQVEWALHCAVVLAGLPEGRYLSTKALAELHGVPKEYLSKALQALSQAGLVDATLGPSGGYRLARNAAEVSFLEVVEAVEGRGPSFVCTEIRANNPCRSAGACDAKPCGIARVMREADRAWRDSLRKVSVAQMVEIVAEEVDPELLRRTAEWVAARS